jgi:3-methyladenine DNA glycosylase/8-oxoguanine DNA glycosylase
VCDAGPVLMTAAFEAHRRSVPASSWRDVVLTLAPLRRGGGDPAHRLVNGTLWRASRTPAGVASLALRPLAGGAEAVAFGPGAAWLVERLPTMLGLDQDWSALDVSAVPRLHETHRRHAGLRLPNTGLVLESLVPAILEQKVTGVEARAAWRMLLYRYGAPAPSPAPPSMRVLPSAADLLAIPTWGWHRLGVDAKRQRAIRAAASIAERLEAFTSRPVAEARDLLTRVPGVGVWTAAETTVRAFGDPDAVSIGDHHLPHLVVHTLTGRPRGSDAEMLELLATWDGQRAWVMRLIELGGVMPPRFGPRLAPGRMPV